MLLTKYIEARKAVTVEHAVHCIANSSRITLNGAECTPDIIDLMTGQRAGGRTIITSEGQWRFTMDKELIMEDPDKPFGIRRDVVTKGFYLFQGDETGLLICPGNTELNHALWLRHMLVTGDMSVRRPSLRPGASKDFVVNTIPGNCRPDFVKPDTIITGYSGVIIPKQKGVADNLISFWYRRGAVRWAADLVQWVHNNMAGRVRVEAPTYNNGDLDISGDIWGEFMVSDEK